MTVRIIYAASLFLVLAAILFRSALYQTALRVLNLGERRCGWCRRFLGWKRGLRGLESTGICKPCQIKFDAETDRWFASKQMEARRARRKQRPRRKTLRRRTGGWSGAVASCGRVS